MKIVTWAFLIFLLSCSSQQSVEEEMLKEYEYIPDENDEFYRIKKELLEYINDPNDFYRWHHQPYYFNEHDLIDIAPYTYDSLGLIE